MMADKKPIPTDDEQVKVTLGGQTLTLSRKEAKSWRGRISASLKVNHSGGKDGRPPIKNRCACGAMTSTRARLRNHTCKWIGQGGDTLFRTPGGDYYLIRNHTSRQVPVLKQDDQIHPRRAAEWLSANGHALPAELRHT